MSSTNTYLSRELTAPESILGGKTRGKSGGNKTLPRSWSEDEASWLLEKKSEGFSSAEIATALSRSEVSVDIKFKRLTKSVDTYNEKFREKKYLANEFFLQSVQPSSVLDAHAGNSWWSGKVDECVTNDIEESFDTDYHLPAFQLLSNMYFDKRSFDVVDLDPFGSAYECFDFAFRIAKRGVIISFGEWGHRRWNRFDFVKPRYGIDSLDSWNQESFILEAQRIASMHKKRATVFDSLQYSNFFRVYFTLSSFKEESQWQQ